MNLQEIFDKVVLHLATQGRQCSDIVGTCYYRHPDDPTLSCAAGCLVPDNLLSLMQEGKGWLAQTPGARLAVLGKKDLFTKDELVFRLQSAHDNCRSGIGLQQKLNEIAVIFDLDKTVLNSLTFPEKWGVWGNAITSEGN